jgi:hypothetical protein
MSRETLAVLLLVALATGCGPATDAPARPPPIEPVGPVEITATHAPDHPAHVAPVDVLRTWDARRAAAWARADPRLLRSLYTDGSLAGRHDVAMLRAWAARGLTVRGLHTQLLAIRVLSHTGSTWTLDVTDRVLGGVAVGRGLRRELPRDQATTRTLRLRRVDGEWLVASVRPMVASRSPGG